MCADTHLRLSIHLVKGRVYWAVYETIAPGRQVVRARGHIEEPMAALYHSPATHLMEAAYEAYRALGE